jgi:hypothetical protein
LEIILNYKLGEIEEEYEITELFDRVLTNQNRYKSVITVNIFSNVQLYVEYLLMKNLKRKKNNIFQAKIFYKNYQMKQILIMI